MLNLLCAESKQELWLWLPAEVRGTRKITLRSFNLITNNNKSEKKHEESMIGKLKKRQRGRTDVQGMVSAERNPHRLHKTRP